jgi:acetaldehyde dehydrogenase (acetylating)
VYGKTFDHGTICSSEQAIVAEESIREQVMEELKRNRAHFLTPADVERLGREMVNLEAHTINPKYVGKSPARIAEVAGIKLGEGTRVLVAPLNGVGREWPLSAEKLSPVLALYFVKDREAAFQTCLSLLRFGGLGHTCVIHSRDDAVIREYGVRMPAGRIVVNSPAPQGSIGSSTNLFPAMTLGCGAMGGNITSDNITPMHLVNLKRVAYEQRPVTGDAKAVPATTHVGQPSSAGPAPSCACEHPAPAISAEKIVPSDRIAVARAVERFLASRKPPQAAPSPVPQPKAAVPALPSRPKPRPVEFVSEAEIRAALRRQEKIIVGPKTIITPAARDLAAEYDVLVRAD